MKFVCALSLFTLVIALGGSISAEETPPPITQVNILVDGHSLHPMAKDNDLLKLWLNYFKTEPNTIARDNIIAYQHSGRSQYLLKIVKAIPGDDWDVIESEPPGRFNITVNGEKLKNSLGMEYSITEDKATRLKLYKTDYPVIPANAYLILGNLPQGSFDSIEFGLVNKHDIKGKIELLEDPIETTPLTITSFSPTSAATEAPIIVEGTGFSSLSMVTIGEASVDSFTIDSDSQITIYPGSGRGKILLGTLMDEQVESETEYAESVLELKEVALTKLNFQVNNYINSHYDTGTQASFQALYILPATTQAVKDALLPVWAWVQSVMGYYYSKKTEISMSSDPASVVWDFSQFDSSDPDMSLQSLMLEQ